MLVRKLAAEVSDSSLMTSKQRWKHFAMKRAERFKADPKYVIRAAMENMQRLALRGLPPFSNFRRNQSKNSLKVERASPSNSQWAAHDRVCFRVYR